MNILKKFSRFGKEKLKELYSDQCGPCMLGYPECEGDQEKAKSWKCPSFHNGLFIMVCDEGESKMRPRRVLHTKDRNSTSTNPLKGITNAKKDASITKTNNPGRRQRPDNYTGLPEKGCQDQE